MMEVEDVRTLQAICRTHADRDLATARALLPSRGWQSPAGEASRPRLLSAESRMMDSAAVIGALGALAQEHRLAAFRLLVQAGDEGMPAGAIAEALGVPHSSLSFHLAQLTRAGPIRQEQSEERRVG